MSVKMPVGAVTLLYVCDKEQCNEDVHEQALADMPEVGTLICPDCGDDMLLVETKITGEPRVTTDIEDETVDALTPDYGRVVLVVDALAVSYGTRYACFKPGDPGAWGTPLIELKREVPGVEVVRL